MHLFATPTARILALAAIVGMLVAAFFREPIAMTWMGSLLAGMTLTRSAAGLKIAQARRKGFEMYLRTGTRRYAVARGETFSLAVVLRNRAAHALHLRAFRVLSSPAINMQVPLQELHLAAGSSVDLRLEGEALRVGHHAMHGLSLRVVDGSGAFEAPLLFINPVQVVVAPAPLRRTTRPSMGGLTRRPSDAERTGRMSGDSIELRELRAHQPGDALRKIAWRASAKRGILLVRDEELMERQSLWFLLDASLELWAGEMGRSALDQGLDHVASALSKHLGLGDRVGLGVISSRDLAWVSPDAGVAQLPRLRQALLKAVQPWDADRSGYDETEVARVVLEHIARLDSTAACGLSPTRLDPLASTAHSIMQRYEFEMPEVYARTTRERTLRQYAAMFGLTTLPRLDAERWHSDTRLLAAIERCVTDRPSRIVIASVDPSPRLLEGIASLRRRLSYHRIRMSWLRFDSAAGLPGAGTPIQEMVNDSIRCRLTASGPARTTQLKRLGIAAERVIEAPANARRPHVA